MKQLWKDTYADLSGYPNPSDFLVKVGGSTVYEGTAVQDPNGDMDIRLNPIVANHLGNEFPARAIAGTQGSNSHALTASVQVEVEDADVFDDTFQYDLSYEDHTGTRSICNAPINGRYVQGMPLIISRVGIALALDVVLTGGDPEEFDDTIEIASGTDNYTLPTDSYIVVSVEQMEDYEYRAVQRCGKSYALYYLNEFGGWDFLLFEGRCSRTETYARQTLSTYASNSYEGARQKSQYANDVTRSWELRTGWLSDEEAALMHHLVGSPSAYLWDSESQRFTAVVITDGECPEKTQDGEGRGVVQYTVSVQEAIVRRR